FSPPLLRQLTTEWHETGPDMFAFLPKEMFQELGLTYPKFRFVTRTDLKPNAFAFKVNHLTTLPFLSLLPDQCLTNEAAEHLKRSWKDLAVRSATNPASGQPGSVVGLESKAELEKAGLTTWDQIGYFILCMADVLRKNGACFVTRPQTQASLQQ